MAEPRRGPPAPEAPAPAPPGILEYIWRVFALTMVGPLRAVHGMQKEVVVTDTNSELAHINTSGKPMFVDIRATNGQPGPIIFVGSSDNVDLMRAVPANLAVEPFRAITYPSDRIFIRKQVPGTISVMVTEVTL